MTSLPAILRNALFAAAAFAEPLSAHAAETTVIHAGHLIAEAGLPVKVNQSVVIEAGRITAVKDGFVAGDKVIDLKDSWVMPGLIDVHTHVSGELKLDEPAAGQLALAYLDRPAERVLSTLPRVKAVLMNGFTTVRNLGDPTSTTYALRDAIEQGIVPGPRMLATEAQISVDGGDMDAARWGVRHDLEPYVAGRGSCTGVTECVKVVRKEVRRGADVIKLRQSGLPYEDPSVAMVETVEEVSAIIRTAHQLGRKVAAHVIGSPAYLHMVIIAGADTIEHGPLDAAAVALMKKHGTAYTPTLLGQKLIEYRFKDASDGTGLAYRAGVPIIFGTDLGIFNSQRTHEEFALLAAAGLPPAEVLRAATINAANALGRGASLGSLAPGKLADVIAMKVDPLADVDQLGREAAVSFVMKEGLVYKHRP